MAVRVRGAVLALACALLSVHGAPALAFDEALYAQLLDRHTRAAPDTAGVRVDYAAVREDPEWTVLVAGLGSSETRVPKDRAAAMAFWINAYNVLVIETVARSYPVESIRDIGSPVWPVWKQQEIAVAGRPRSLDEIEHVILRPMGEPRVHAALVCASVSCPSLLREPWRADRLDVQLEQAFQRWLRDPRKGARLDRETRTLHLSRVFAWFAEDFGDDAAALVRFVAPRLAPADRAWLDAMEGAVEVEYFRYDWRLNDAREAVAAPAAP